MPKKMLTLNDFSGGLNTKSSPRDIAPNEFQDSVNAITSIPGLVKSSALPVDKVASATSLTSLSRGSDMFIFNTQYDITKTADVAYPPYVNSGRAAIQDNPKQVIAFLVNDTDNKVKFYTRDFDTEGNFTLTSNNSITFSNNANPIYNYIDGRLYVSDKQYVDVASDVAQFDRRVLERIDYSRFGTFCQKIVVEAAKLPATTDAIAFSIADSNSFPADANPAVLPFNISDGDFALIYDIDTSSGDGGWQAGEYEFTYTLVNLSGDETLPHTFSSAPSTATLSDTNYFKGIGIRVGTTNEFRPREKGVRIYTRKKDSNERFILFLDVDYERGARTNLFDDFKAFSYTGSHSYDNQSTVKSTAEVTSLVAKNPSLDTYSSINGYSHEEESLDIGGYKASCVAQRRLWVANVKRDSIKYDDRIYYTPVNRFNTFPSSYFLDIGINDGDSFTALESLGNRILAFKQRKLYIINVSTSSDAGWYLEAEYEGMGCEDNVSVCKTPFGVCFLNKEGLFIYTGQGMPVELSAKLDDNSWKSLFPTPNSAIKSPSSLAYDAKHKNIMFFVDAFSQGSSDVYSYDFITQSWNILRRAATTSDNAVHKISNLVEAKDGLYSLDTANISDESGTPVKLQKFDLLNSTSSSLGNQSLSLTTKDIDFGSPGKIKKIYKVYIACRDGGNDKDIKLSYATDGSSSYSTPASQDVNSSNYVVKVFDIDQSVESIAFKIESTGQMEISDINVEYREIYKRAS